MNAEEHAARAFIKEALELIQCYGRAAERGAAYECEWRATQLEWLFDEFFSEHPEELKRFRAAFEPMQEES